MILAPVLVTPPVETPISLEEAKEHLRIFHDDDDDTIAAYLASAVSFLDGHSGVLGRCLVSQEWTAAFPGWPGSGMLRLPFPDVSEAVVAYSDADDAEHEVSASLFQLAHDAQGSFIWLRRGFNRPTVHDDRLDPVRVTFTAGYGDAADVPGALKAAIRLIVGHLYENRESVVVGTVDAKELPMGVAALVNPFRRVGL